MKKLISITILLLIPTFLFSQNEIKIIGILKLKNNSFFIENQFKRYVFYSDSINLKKFKNKNVIVEVKKLYETKPTKPNVTVWVFVPSSNTTKPTSPSTNPYSFAARLEMTR